MINFEQELNAEQLEVVKRGDGPCLVLAGAGSGKTRTITYRVAYLLEQGIPAENILLVTFTNKVAAEMKERVARLMESGVAIPPFQGGTQGGLPSDVSRGRQTSPNLSLERRGSQTTVNLAISKILPWSGTFHHIAYRIMRQYAPLLGYKNNFTILDSGDSEAILKLSIKEFKPDGEAKRFPSPSVVKAVISYARNANIALAEAVERKFDNLYPHLEALGKIANDYEGRKKAANAMDFDDLLVNLLVLLDTPSGQTSPNLSLERRGSEMSSSVGEKFAKQFKYILVDEYQDTNKIQALIIKKLAAIHQNVLAVGDDAQSIYSFRAADIANILQFSAQGACLSGRQGFASGGEGYADAKIFKLETNYRSGKEILDLANEVIANNVKQYQKKLKTILELGYKPKLQPQLNQRSEADFIVTEINKLLEAGVEPQEIAVLFRAAHHSQQLEMELVKSGIAYDYRGGLRFFERAHVKDLLAYLRLASNLADTSAWMRVLLHEEGIGMAGAQRIVEVVKNLRDNGDSDGDSGDIRDKGDSGEMGEGGGIKGIKKLREIGGEVLGAKAQVGWGNFLEVFEVMMAAGTEPVKMIEAILSSRYRGYLEAEFADSQDRIEDIRQMMVFAKNYTDLEQFLAEAVLQEGFNEIAGRQTSPNLSLERRGSDRIVLSTVHQAKGLEWHSVFVINLASGAFPNDRAAREDGGTEEERRLFYVAITRAKKNLILTYPLEGSWGGVAGGPSIFLSEVKSDLLDDRSLLSYDTTVLNDPDSDIQYVPEDRPMKIMPGNFLRSIEDL